MGPALVVGDRGRNETTKDCVTFDVIAADVVHNVVCQSKISYRLHDVRVSYVENATLFHLTLHAVPGGHHRPATVLYSSSSTRVFIEKITFTIYNSDNHNGDRPTTLQHGAILSMQLSLKYRQDVDTLELRH